MLHEAVVQDVLWIKLIFLDLQVESLFTFLIGIFVTSVQTLNMLVLHNCTRKWGEILPAIYSRGVYIYQTYNQYIPLECNCFNYYVSTYIYEFLSNVTECGYVSED
jgi:hypothetical protein